MIILTLIANVGMEFNQSYREIVDTIDKSIIYII